jgi:predicted Rossmann fold nucleotide-binding protein DprA/Smf involved in DNA uptake
MNHRLSLISPYDPAAGFNVGHAMQRNKLVYALADAAFVVNSDFEKGGTWAGAIEQLERLHFVPLFVRNGGGAGKGNSALLQRGGRPWPNPRDGEELAAVFSLPHHGSTPEPKQAATLFGLPGSALPENAFSEMKLEGEHQKEPSRALFISHQFADPSPADELLKVVRAILEPRLVYPHSEAEIVQLLGVTKTQAKAWLSRLVEAGFLEPLKKPVRYRVANSSERLL